MARANYDGIVLNQNSSPVNTITAANWVYQTFLFPTNLQRGTTALEQRYPDFSGFQLCLNVSDPIGVNFQYTIDQQIPGLGWVSHATGTTNGAVATNNRVWVDVYFDNFIPLNNDLTSDTWRIGVKGSGNFWVSQPNPLALQGLKTYASDGTTPLTLSGNEYSLMFRLLGLSADEGIDFLGNPYRSVVVRNSIDTVLVGNTNQPNGYWLSKPNPSKFAVECLYFDMRDTFGNAQVVDRILADPITPGVYFHIYYSNEGDPGTDNASWENKLWTHVPYSFRMSRREEHALPEPINAKYLCVEFSHLQAQHYSPGVFQQPVIYKKHPKWVLDYFLFRTANITHDPFVANNVEVQYDALDLAYNYYLDDLVQTPDTPTLTQLNNFLTSRSDLSDQIDPTTLDQIKTVLAPYRQQPGTLNSGIQYLLGVYTSQFFDSNYPLETEPLPQVPSSLVSSINREAVVFEQFYPVMYFYVTSRHAYRELKATLSSDKAYFAGVRELAFTRDHYTVASDTDLYIDTLGDYVNTWVNDFND